MTLEEAATKITEHFKVITGESQNLKEQAVFLVGSDSYEKLINGSVEKQWGRALLFC